MCLYLMIVPMPDDWSMSSMLSKYVTIFIKNRRISGMLFATRCSVGVRITGHYFSRGIIQKCFVQSKRGNWREKTLRYKWKTCLHSNITIGYPQVVLVWSVDIQVNFKYRFGSKRISIKPLSIAYELDPKFRK